MSTKRIALLCQHFYPEMISTGLHMTELATGLTQSGCHIAVYCAQPAYQDNTQDGTTSAYMEYKGIQIKRMKTIGDTRGGLLRRGLFGLSFLLATFFAIWQDRKQLNGVIVTTNPPFIGLVASALKRLAGLPYITIIYDIYPDIALRLGALSPNSPIVPIWRSITRHIFNRADALVVIGRDMEKIVRQKLKNPTTNRICLIPNWSDETHICPIPPEENPFIAEHKLQGKFVVQYSGRMGRTHNIEPLLEAAGLLTDLPVMFQLIGDGAKRKQLVQLAEEKKLQNVQFLPYQPFEILMNVLAAPQLAVVCLEKQFTGLSVPSKTYGIMASGRPILAFLEADSEIGLMIAETRSGVVLPEPGGEQIADLIRHFMNEPDKLTLMGANGRQAFLATYTLSQAVEKYRQVIDHYLLSNNRQ